MAIDERKSIIGWSMYDWANSAFATTIMAGFFPIFFKEYWSVGVDVNVSTAQLGLANSTAGIIVALSAPILGAIADRGTAKKKFLLFFAFMGVVMTSTLAMVSEGYWQLAVFIYVMATIGFSGGNIFYDSLLPGVASEKKLDRVSALGYALGYLGGGILFAVNVWMTLKPTTFGLADTVEAVRYSFVCVGIWWAVFTIPLILWVKEPKLENSVSGWQMVRAGYVQLIETFGAIRHMKAIFLFLLAYWLYIDGVDTIVRMAVDYGLSLGFAGNDLIVALLIVQFVGFPAAIGFGYLGGRIGVRRSIFIALAVYLLVVVWAALMQEKREFYVMAVVIGLVQGGIQALSRSYYARIIPADKTAEFFGFYNMLGKFAVVIGPLLIGGVGLLFRRAGYGELFSTRAGISSIALLFIAGGVLLYFVDEVQGKKEVQILSEKR